MALATNVSRPPTMKTLSHDRAFEAWMKLGKPKIVVADKLFVDHILKEENSSKQVAIEAAKERYRKQPKILTSSWMLSREATLINKANDAPKKALTHQGGQQLAVTIRIAERVVEFERITRKQSLNLQCIEVEVNGETHYLIVRQKDRDKTICLVGGWDPPGKKFELFHYEAKGAPQNHAMLPKFLDWRVDDKNVPLSPKAGKG